MEIRVDTDLCEANAVCCGIAPEVFELDDEENLLILTQSPTAEQLPPGAQGGRALPEERPEHRRRR